MFASKDIFLKSSGGYQISRSVRLRASATAYLNRTNSSSVTNNKIFTYSLWVKRGSLGVTSSLLAGDNSTAIHYFGYGNSSAAADTLEFYDGQTAAWKIQTNAVYRDPSAYYHVILSVDTTQATAANRVRIYVNGVECSYATATYPAQNTVPNINVASMPLYIGRRSNASQWYFDGYLTEVNFIDGQALTPNSFGTFNSYGVWQPITYGGSYGTNGFYLPFTNTTSTTTLGYDFSPNGNNWTTNNISLTAGTTYDSMTDVPTLTSATAANYSVANPLSTLFTVTAGNMDFTYTNSTSGVWYLKGTLAVSSDKYYWEVTPTNVGAGSNISIGIILSSNTQTNTTTINLVTDGYVYHCDGNKYSGAGGATGVAYGATYTNNDVIGVALDLTAGTLVFYKNNVSQGTAFTGLTSSYMQLICNHLGGTSRTVAGSVNAGQRPFTYTPPTGFVALNTQNLPTPTISNGAQYMAATTYTGNGTTQSISNAVNGISFQPDFAWFKNRSGANNHALYDSVRGRALGLISNATNAEQSASAGNDLVSFDSNGVSLGPVEDFTSVNGSAQSIVAWQWNAGGSTVTNTSGTISAQVRANPTAGFSVVTYTGNGTSGATVGHGLGVAPAMMIVKNRSSGTEPWRIYHKNMAASPATVAMNFDTGAASASSTRWNNTAPTSSVFTVGNDASVNANTNNYVAYLFAAVAGYSAFGSYTGNGSADGPFVFTGFRPRFVMFKRTDTTGDWQMYDSSRDTYNVTSNTLYANGAFAEDSNTTNRALDLLSNGFKLRSSASFLNASGGTYIYMAFAENPLKLSLAR